MPPRSFANEFKRALVFQLLRAILWTSLGSFVTAGYLTNAQARWVLLALTTFLIAFISTAWASVTRYVRSMAMRRLPPDASPKDVRELGWEILRDLVNMKLTTNEGDNSDDTPKS